MLHRRSLAYSTTTLASSMMNSLFFFYYVKLFLDKYQVSQTWFHVSQVVYMIWNAINDPLFGYFQDNSKLEIFRERRKSILYGAPLYALCFLLPWFAWGQPGSWIAGFHLMFSLCAYDALLTFVLLAQCALFTEMSQRHEDRLRLVKYLQVASLLGSTSVFISSAVSDNMNNFFRLQLFCIFVAVVAWLCMRYTGMHADTQYHASGSSNGDSLLPTKSPEVKQTQDDDLSMKDMWKITLQICKNKNFLAFVFMNFFQVFHTAFGAGFLMIFADHLIPSDVLPSFARSAVYGASFFLPQVMVLLGGGIIRRCGSFNVIMTSFFIQCSLAVLMFVMGRQMYWLLAVFFILDLSIPNAMFSLFNIPLSDIIDQDIIINNCKNPRSAMVFGTNALITKPAQSLAPMLAVTVLNWFNYENLKKSGIPKENKTEARTLLQYEETGEIDALHDAMFTLLCAVPFTISFIQIIVWSRYNLRSTHTTQPKYMEDM